MTAQNYIQESKVQSESAHHKLMAGGTRVPEMQQQRLCAEGGASAHRKLMAAREAEDAERAAARAVTEAKRAVRSQEKLQRKGDVPVTPQTMAKKRRDAKAQALASPAT